MDNTARWEEMKLSPREKKTFQLHSEALTSCLLNYSKVNAKTVKQWSITATLCYTRSLQIKSFTVAWVGSLFICNSCLQKPQNQNPSACLEHRVSDTLPSHPPMGPSGCLSPQVPSREGGPAFPGGSAAKHGHRWTISRYHFAPTTLWPMIQDLYYHHSVN